MRVPLRKRIAFAAAAAACALALLPSTARAQGDLPTTTPRSGTPPATPKPAGPRVVVKTTYVKVTSVTVVADSEAYVTLTPVQRPSNVKSAVIPKDKKSVTFYDVPSGPYRVRAELDERIPDEEPFVVVAHRAHDVELKLNQITYNVPLSLNVASGRVLYSDGKEPPAVVAISKGSAVLPNLKRGSYVVRVEPDNISYETDERHIAVPSRDGRYAPIELKWRETTTEFSGHVPSDWALPSGWGVNSLRLVTGGRGLALPSNDAFNHYRDFELSTNARMINGIAVSFALRARDSKNYYLVQLTGVNGDERYVARGFVVKDGVEKPLAAASPISHLAETIKPGKDFHLNMTMKGDVIRITVDDSETGETITVGVLSGFGDAFTIGAVGVVVRGDEQFEVESFTVSPLSPQQTP